MTESPRNNLYRKERQPLVNIPFIYICKRKPKKRGTTENVHLANKTVLVDRPALLPARQLGRLGPHLLDVFEHHVAVPVKCFHASQQLPVVADRDEDLGVAADGGLEDREGAGGEFICTRGASRCRFVSPFPVATFMTLL